MSEYYVYVIATETKDGSITGPIKVGHTRNPDKRLSSIRTSCPNRIAFACVFSFPNPHLAGLIEGLFHETMKERRRVGEWFDVGPIEAVLSACECIEATLSMAPLDTDEDRDCVFVRCGAWHARQRAKEEFMRAAWEGET